MKCAGIDIGSRSIELIVLRGDSVVASRRLDATYDPVAQCRALLDGASYECLVATGYGRRLLADTLGVRTVSEIRAYALGARHHFPRCRAVLDIGGQDTKAIALDKDGEVGKFELNDRCAAGTGKFLEFMAASFQVPLEEFGRFALRGSPGIVISSMCTVFAETEVTSLIAQGKPPADVALAVHGSVINRSLSMLRRVSTDTPLVFAGGVARNACMVELLRREIPGEVLVPPAPEFTGALGAALCARKLVNQEPAAR